MGRTSREMGGAVGVLALIAALVVLLSPLTGAEAAVITSLGSVPKVSKAGGTGVTSVTFRDPAASEGYWTRDRMLAARPVDDPTRGSVASPRLQAGATTSAATGDFVPGNVTAFPQRVHGRAFFVFNNVNYACSATLVDSAARNVIFTAAHCLFDETTRKVVSNFAFVPAYENGKAPYGVFYVRSVYVPTKWTKNPTHSYDVGVATLDSPLQDTIGARQIAFDLSPMISKKKRRQYTIYGYPSSPADRFDGETLRGCRAAFRYFDGTDPNVVPYPLAASPCYMGHGASGGGWITLGNYLNSVVTHGYCEERSDTCGQIFGTYFSNAAKAIYDQAGGSPAPTLKLVKAPPKVVRKRRVIFKFSSLAATLPGYLCRLDRKKAVGCSSTTSVNQLRPGKHTLRVWAIDQTGHKSRKKIVRNFRVILPRR